MTTPIPGASSTGVVSVTEPALALPARAPAGLIRRMLPMIVLYGGRIGVAGLGLVVLPWFSRLMPSQTFGLVTTILSLQSLVVVLDLGLSVTLARELPILADGHVLLRRSENTLLRLHLAATGVAIILSVMGILPVSPTLTGLIGVSLLLVVWQNILVVSFIGRQRFVTATVSQFLSLLARQVASLSLVAMISTGLEAFVLGQIGGGAIVLIISRLGFFRATSRQDRMSGPPSECADTPTPSTALNLPMMLYTAAGAMALQLDKPLISALSSPARTGSYFLASMLSLVPITFLATPVSQFVQPKLIAALAREQTDDAARWIGRLTVAIAVLAVLPGLALALFAEPIVGLWLHGSPTQVDIGHYVALLAPGAAIGAMGLVPAIVLIGRRDYRAMAVMSCGLTTAILLVVILLARQGNIAGICMAYACYHALSAILLWCRAWWLEPAFARSLAIWAQTANDTSQSGPTV